MLIKGKNFMSHSTKIFFIVFKMKSKIYFEEMLWRTFFSSLLAAQNVPHRPTFPCTSTTRLNTKYYRVLIDPKINSKKWNVFEKGWMTVLNSVSDNLYSSRYMTTLIFWILIIKGRGQTVRKN